MLALEVIENEQVIAWIEVENDQLELIAVAPEYRNMGHGIRALGKLLIWMRSKNIRKLNFLNSVDGFWRAAKRTYPKNIFISNNMEGMIVS